MLALCSFLPTDTPAEIEAHRPVVPATSLDAMTSRALLFQHGAALAPQRVFAEGFVRQGCAEAIQMAWLVAELAPEVKVDQSGELDPSDTSAYGRPLAREWGRHRHPHIIRNSTSEHRDS